MWFMCKEPSQLIWQGKKSERGEVIYLSAQGS